MQIEIQTNEDKSWDSIKKTMKEVAIEVVGYMNKIKNKKNDEFNAKIEELSK